MSDSEREVQADELLALSTGAWILGTGGGGNPYQGYLNMRLAYDAGKRVRLLDPRSLADDDLVAVVSTQGAPLVGQERLKDPAVCAKPVRMLEDYLGRKFQAVMSVEIGGSNAFQPFLVALETGLPVVDADAMGRAFPEAQMTSFAVHDLQCYPLALADIRDNEIVIPKAASWKWMERISRKICVEIGSVAATCKAPRSGREVRECAILDTVTQAIDLGRAVIAAREAHLDPIDAVIESEGGIKLFTGKVSDVARRTTEGFLRGSAKLEGLEGCRGARFDIDFQNEFIIGRLDGVIRVTSPDLICVLDSESGEGIGTETLRYGQRVTVLALPAPPVLLSERGLELVGPRAFGYDLDFASLFPGGRQ
jgi:DUF917 family protein